MIDWFVIGILTALLLGQQVYWANVVRHLTDKLMSRDYQNYAETKKQFDRKPTLQKTSSLADDVIDPTSEIQAQELNSILGMV